MRYEWDDEKRQQNLIKHKVDFCIAETIDWDVAAITQDKRREYGEFRFRALVPIVDRLYVMVFTLRSDVVRIISLRKANLREWRKYNEKA